MSAATTLTPIPPSDLAERAAPIFKALADPTRLKIVAFLADPAPECCSQEDAVCACDLEDVTGLSQPTVSHHMKILIGAGLVHGEKRGRWMHYRLEPHGFETARRLLAALGG